ncbi:MAG: 5-formyltetrahydrofolate cyclo-ligase [Eubacterium sp.]|nr:5-formyltetrahydrofolate cyclo-ligase [Eubacterium sp.]
MKSENQFSQNNKKILRKEALKSRKNVRNKPGKDKDIFRNFTKTDFYKNSDIILCYVSLDDEIDTKEIINKALSDNKRVAVPLCIDQNGNMDFRFINSLNELKSGYKGIPEPDKEKSESVRDFSNAIAVVPGLCFTKEGKRLGYGGGYYDRFLKNNSLISIGLCYNSFMLNDIPTDEYDISVKCVISESCIYGG